jgi:Asp-tRNA(Asn)/Glu-tRNA(Gln) amidotransferase A subunit family amidase
VSDARGPARPLGGSWNLSGEGGLGAWRERFEAVEPSLHAFLPEPGRWRRVAAEIADRERTWPDATARPPLFAAPVGVKDVFRVAGLPTLAGFAEPPVSFAGEEAEAVRRLRAAGAVVAGKTVTTEGAFFEPGPTENPRAPGHTPGGSSSGSAAAVGAGLVPLALGTQTIGSVCRPAAFCGVVGFKPSRERIPRDGLVPLSPSLDHVGVLAASVEWARRAAAVLCDGWLGGEAPAGRPRLGLPVGPYLDPLEPAARDHLAAVCGRLRAAGLEVVEIHAFADFPSLAERHRRIVAAEAAVVHAAGFARHPERYRPRTAELVERGLGVDPVVLAADLAGRERLRLELERLMSEHAIDLWLSPAAPGPPPRGLATTGDPILNLPWTHAGLPVVALPAGATPDGLPLGIQLTARFGDDEGLLARAAALASVVEGTGG